MKVGGGLPIVKLFELGGDLNVLFQALLYVLVVLSIALSLIVLGLLEVVREGEEGVLGLFESCFTCSLVQPLLFFETDRGLDLARGRVCCDVEEVNVRLKIALLY